MGFDDESVRRSGGSKIDDIGKRDFQSDNTSIFHSLFTQNYTWPKKLELMEEWSLCSLKYILVYKFGRSMDWRVQAYVLIFMFYDTFLHAINNVYINMLN